MGIVLPAAALQPYVVTIDYARRDIGLAPPGALRAQGEATPFTLDEATGLIAVEAKIDGQAYPVTIDAGSGYTWITKAAARDWLPRHPAWLRGVGAVGVANMQRAGNGIEREGQLIRVPQIDIGPVRLTEVGVLAVGPDTKGWDLIGWYGKKNAEPVIGWLGGNVLSRFRLTIDYPARRLYWRREAPDSADDLAEVGLTFRRDNGRLVVDAVTTRDGRPLVECAKAGDAVLRAGDLSTEGIATAKVFEALSGRPGETRRLTLERNGKAIACEAKVVAF